jgi:peptidyl-prolyl cis-trans isomerase SurA
MKKSYGFADNFAKTSKWFVQNIDTNYVKGKWNASKLKSDKVMFTLADQKFTQKQFAKYLEKNYRAVRSTDNRTLVEKQYANFQKAEILAYEERQLDSKYPEFKALMKEYHDGILLYEVMTDKVWNKAIKDTAGLRVYFNANNNKYVWGERANAYVYECTSKEVAAKVATLLKSDTISSKTIIGIINKDSELNLRVRTGKFETATTSYLKNQVIKKGVNPVYQFENKYYVVKVDELLPAGPKLLSEAKGAATSDYQTYLEKQWLEEIAKKHPIIVNKQVLYSLGN